MGVGNADGTDKNSPRSGIFVKISTYLMSINIKSAKEIELMRIAGRLAADVLDMIGEHVVPGIIP